MLPFQRSRLMLLNPRIGSRFLFERNVLIKHTAELAPPYAKFIDTSCSELFIPKWIVCSYTKNSQLSEPQ